MDGVPALVDEIRLEVLLGDGTRLIVLRNPLGDEATDGTDWSDAPDLPPPPARTARETRTLIVTNTGTHVIRVSSHYPFEQVNKRLEFDRDAARGFRLDLPAGATLRWATRRDPRSNSGPLRRQVVRRSEFHSRYGPTAGDRIRVADSDLWLRVEDDRQAHGDEPLCGLRQDDPLARGSVGAGWSERARHDHRRRRHRRPRRRRGEGGHRHQGRTNSRYRGRRESGHQRRHRPCDRPAHRADHGLRPRRDAGRGRQPRPPDYAGADPDRAVRRRDDAHHRRFRGAAVGDGAQPPRRSRSGRSTSACRPTHEPQTTQRSTPCSTPAPRASRSTRTTARTRS